MSKVTEQESKAWGAGEVVRMQGIVHLETCPNPSRKWWQFWKPTLLTRRVKPTEEPQ